MSVLDNKKISFIGGGNMAQALISGLVSCGVKPSLITVADPSSEAREQLAAKGLNTVDPTADAKAAVIDADIVVLAVKPQVMKAVVSSFAHVLDKQLVISVAAGLSTELLSDMLGGYDNIVRAMPNTPAMIQMGATGLYGTDNISAEQKQLATAVMEASGLVMWVDNEEHMHAVTAVSGSAPAYMFYFIEAMVDGAVALGLDKEQASALAMQTMLGAAKMAMGSEDAPSELRRKVTSPNGTTQAAIIDADIVVLAVKPQVMKAVVSSFADALDKQLVISVAAGLSTELLSNMLGGYKNIVRAMPNTPAMIQMGATGLYGTDNISAEQKQLATAVMEASGLVMWVDNEEHMHAVTAVSGSAPAYMFYFIESMVDGAVALGLDKEQASALAMQTMLGAAKMAMNSEDAPAELRRKVTSPNGTTQAAVESMQANDIGRQIVEAMQACYDRSQALSEEMSK